MKQAIILLTALCTLIGCGSSKTATQPSRDVSTDTVYMNNQRYDSIYIYHDRTLEFHPQLSRITQLESSNRNRSLFATDTVYIKDISVEYRYKQIRDTIFRSRIDSIPYEVTIVETHEIPRSLTWFDKVCRFSFLLIIAILVYYLRIIHRH